MCAALAAPLGWRALWGGPVAGTAPASKRVAVVFPSALDPCAEAVKGLRLRLPGDSVALNLLDLNAANFASDFIQELARKPSVVVAVGSEAVRAVHGRSSPAMTISTMTLEVDRTGSLQTVRAGVCLDIPVRTLLAELHRLFPNRTRVAVIRNPTRRDPSAAQIRSQGPDFTSIESADCAAPDELLPAFLSLRKKADLVICFPDGTLYNSATARPLIMASLENRLPIVGFSPAFLRAGAAAAIFPDYRAIGEQTADLVRRCLEQADCACWESPKKVNVAVNAKILRMFGIEFAAPSHPDVGILR